MLVVTVTPINDYVIHTEAPGPSLVLVILLVSPGALRAVVDDFMIVPVSTDDQNNVKNRSPLRPNLGSPPFT